MIPKEAGKAKTAVMTDFITDIVEKTIADVMAVGCPFAMEGTKVLFFHLVDEHLMLLSSKLVWIRS